METEEAKHSTYELDVGNLMVSNTADVDAEEYSKDKWACFSSMSQKAANALIQNIRSREDIHDGSDPFMAKVVSLDTPEMLFPREKKVPVPKPPTKWELFAKRKGIVKPKRSQKVWNQETHSYVPRFGKGSTKQMKKENEGWIVEDKAGLSDNPFEGVNEKKLKQVTKPRKGQKLSKMLSKVQMTPGSIGRDGYMKRKDADLLLKIAQRSSASLGNFSKNLKGEKIRPRKRKLKESDFTEGSDKLRNARVLERMTKKHKK
ncbi:hypothetical protein EIN_092140 [Entamoeba invadens IP1]|uniref:Ribosome biogenesis regulatory protein n=1 Tax=Entamoeba invadens IP1 TaxID=370355 RepID=A0A0A1TYS6_ENTIV|nr:hypothetical protein EIN_092140 [Entamoeba invadens IP1]ELP86649.1 hypothetical protein EIN_092140 [Entamoeba invadens IP1]|eukprot:XP_004185995.1 hypothetical protein EIN_092140 [Entamoeba invadens IP1]